MDNVMRLVDAAALDPRITPEQLTARYGRNDHVFSLLAVAEAILNRFPAGVTRWLSAPGARTMWEEVLTVQEGNHQLSWWSKMITFGIEHPDTLRADRRLARIRRRRREARFVVTASMDRPVDGRVAVLARGMTPWSSWALRPSSRSASKPGSATSGPGSPFPTGT